MGKKFQAAVPSYEWYVCDGCSKESGRLLGPPFNALMNSELDIPAGWSRLTLRSTEPLEDDRVSEFCVGCTSDLSYAVDKQKLGRIPT